jgi:putative DNA primase/helicase
MANYRRHFDDAIRAAGLTPPDAIEPGRFHRFPGVGKRNGNKAGWCKLFDDGRGGIFGDFSTGAVESWRPEQPRSQTPAERETFRRDIEKTTARAESTRNAEHTEARKRAAAIWDAGTPARIDHPYLVAKGVKPHGIRQYGDDLVIPIREGAGLHSLQTIGADGEKRFLFGGRVTGCYFSVGKPTGVLCIAEGYATAASIHEATGYAVAVAFNAGNLLPVAVALRAKLSDVRIVLCADDDYCTDGNPGIAKATGAALAVGGLLALPDFGDSRPEGATDFNDLWRHGGREALERAIANAQPVETPEGQPKTTSAIAANPTAASSRLAHRCVAEVAAVPIRWLWPGRIARGKVTLIAGHPGLGKSQLTLNLAAVVSTGGRWPVDRARSECGSVVILSAEDDVADTIRPRLEAAGADVSRCHVVDAVRDVDSAGEIYSRAFNLAADVARLEALLLELGDVGLVVIDPLTAYLGGADSHKNAEVRGLLAPLGEMAARCGVAVVCVSHLNKGGSSEALLRVSGSLGFVAAARAAFIVTKDTDNSLRRLFLPLKNNLCSDETGLAFAVEPHQLADGIETSRILWEFEQVTVTADEAMVLVEAASDRTEIADASEWLRDLLATGPVEAREVLRLAAQQGFNPRMAQRGRQRIGATTRREGFGKGSRVLWSISIDDKLSIDDAAQTRSPMRPVVVYGAGPDDTSKLAATSTAEGDQYRKASRGE